MDDSSRQVKLENLKLHSKLISRTKQVDLLESQLKIKQKELEQFQNLYLHSKEMLLKLSQSMSQSVESQDSTDSTFLDELLNREKESLRNMTPVHGSVGTVNPMSPNSRQFNPKSALETTIADQVLESNLVKIEELTRREKAHQDRIAELEDTLEKFHLESEKKYNSLHKKFEATLKDLTTLKESNISDENPENYTQHQLKTLIRNFKTLKSQNSKLKDNLKKYAQDWTRDLEQSSNQILEVVELKKNYEQLQQDYKTLDQKLTQDANREFDTKIKSRDEIIKQQALQIQNILWENHKLREYIKKRLGLVLNPINFRFFKVEDIENHSDLKDYTLIGEQVEQITKLRQKVYLMTSNENYKEEELKSKQKGSQQDKNGQNYYLAHQKVLEGIKAWQEGAKKLNKDKKKLESKLQRLNQSTSDEIEVLKAQVESLQLSLSNVTDKLKTLTEKNNKLEIDKVSLQSRISSLQKANGKSTSDFGRVYSFGAKPEGKSNQNVTKDEIWDGIEVTVEEVYDPRTILSSSLQEVQSLLKEVQSDIKESVSDNKVEGKSIKKYEALKNNCEVLEGLLKNEKLSNEQNLKELLGQFDDFKKKHSSLGHGFDDFLSTLNIDQDLEEMSPLLMCFKLKKELSNLEER